MTNQLITHQFRIDYSFISLMSSISYVWSSIDELGRWCLKVGGAEWCTAGKEVSMVTLKRPPLTWALSHWKTQWNTYQPTAKLLDLPKGGWAGQKLPSLQANMRAKWALQMIASSKLCVELTRSPCEGPGPPQALCGLQEWANAYRHHKVSLRTAKDASKFPASKGCWRALLRG